MDDHREDWHQRKKRDTNAHRNFFFFLLTRIIYFFFIVEKGECILTHGLHCTHIYIYIYIQLHTILN